LACMKCGRDTLDGQAFCVDCQKDMARYPVKPNIVVQLPQKKTTAPVKRAVQSRRRPISSSELIRRLRKRCRTFVALWLVTLLLLLPASYFAAKYFFGETIHLPGQNYSTFSTVETEEP